jgi:predicted phosphohydrolase
MITLVHVSDLHIGEKLRWLGSFGPRSATRHPNNLPSKRGHDERVARDLANEWRSIVNAQPSTTIVVTGDLTRSGKPLQFGIAHRYTHAYCFDAIASLLIGLGAGGTRALTIPGNHDFWGGLLLGPVVFRNVLEGHFWPPPWIHVLAEPTGKPLEVHLLAIDSCSGLRVLSPSQVRARGAIHQNQLAAADALIDAENRKAEARQRSVVRIVLVHHPPNTLTQASRQAFEAWLGTHRIHAILTGHTHVPVCSWLPAATGCFELRCGTTLQAGAYNMLPGPKPNHFYLHTLRWHSNQVHWQSIEYWHTGANWTTSFQPVWNCVL